MSREVDYSFKDLEKIARLDLHTGFHSVGYKSGDVIAYVGRADANSYTLIRGSHLRNHVILVLDNLSKTVFMYQAGVSADIVRLVDGNLEGRTFIKPKYEAGKVLGVADIKDVYDVVNIVDFNNALLDEMRVAGFNLDLITLTDSPTTNYAIALSSFIGKNVDKLFLKAYKRVIDI